MIFCPEYYCEINVIGVCCAHMKQFIRKRTDQKYHTMLRLIEGSTTNFRQQQVHLKLFRSFWHCSEAYNQGKDYGEVLQLFFGKSCSRTNKGHLQVSNTNLNTQVEQSYEILQKSYENRMKSYNKS